MVNASNFLIPVLAAAVLATAALSERLTNQTPKPGPVHIVYWEKWTGFEYDGVKAIVDDFNRSQDRIHVDLLTVSDLANKTLLAISAGVPPDVAGLWGPNVAQYADDRALQPMDEYCAAVGLNESHYIPVYWKIGNYRGHTYALPSTPSSTALHYNTHLFSEAGLDPARPPETIEELTAMADKLTTKVGGRLDVAGFLPAEPGWWNWGWGYYFGGKLWDGKDRITANSPDTIKGFEWVQTFSKKYGPTEVQTFKSGFGNFSSPQNAFMSEKVAMEVQGVWMHNFISMYTKTLEWKAAEFPPPAGRPDLAGVNFPDMDVLVIPRGAKHPKEAFEFINYVQSQPAMEKLCLLHEKNSPLRVISEEFYRKHGNPFIRLFDKLARSPNAVPPPQLGIWPEFAAEMNNAFDEIGLMTKTPKQALDYVTGRMQPKLDQYLRRRNLRDKLDGVR